MISYRVDHLVLLWSLWSVPSLRLPPSTEPLPYARLVPTFMLELLSGGSAPSYLVGCKDVQHICKYSVPAYIKSTQTAQNATTISRCDRVTSLQRHERQKDVLQGRYSRCCQSSNPQLPTPTVDACSAAHTDCIPHGVSQHNSVGLESVNTAVLHAQT